MYEEISIKIVVKIEAPQIQDPINGMPINNKIELIKYPIDINNGKYLRVDINILYLCAIFTKSNS